MNHRYNSLSKKGNGKDLNEDSIGIKEFDHGILCVVCDGLGGGIAAEQASKLCVNSILNYFSISEDKNYLTMIRESIILANAVLFEISLSKEKTKWNDNDFRCIISEQPYTLLGTYWRFEDIHAH